MSPLDFNINFIELVRKCSKCGKTFESMEQVRRHCIDQPCRQNSQTEL